MNLELGVAAWSKERRDFDDFPCGGRIVGLVRTPDPVTGEAVDAVHVEEIERGNWVALLIRLCSERQAS